MSDTSDMRPNNCRFRLQEEGKPYPRSSCTACGKNIATGFGNRCSVAETSAATALTAKDKEIEALRERLKEAEEGGKIVLDIGRNWKARADTAERELDEARAALKPFAEAASSYDDSFSDDEPTWGDYGLKLGHLRAARAVIKQGDSN